MCMCMCVWCVCVCLCICVCLSASVCVKVLKEELKFVIFFSKKLNVNEIYAISKTHKYKQYKKNLLYCVSQSRLCMGKKCKM